jgi:membrane associated rhomboid family serine protease
VADVETRARRGWDMGDPGAGGRSPTVVRLLVAANAVVFVMWMLPGIPIQVMVEHFLVSWDYLMDGRIWVLVTSVFSHNLLFHLLVNMIVLLSFGPPLERLMGSGAFLAFYLAAGAVGSFAHAAVSFALLGSPHQPALGASSAIAGLLLLFALVFPRARVLLFFIIPLPAIVAALAFIGIDIWGLMAQVEGEGLPIGHGAHLGGAFTGVVYYLLRRRTLSARRSRLRM